jgi:hypothetical protein
LSNILQFRQKPKQGQAETKEYSIEEAIRGALCLRWVHDDENKWRGVWEVISEAVTNLETKVSLNLENEDHFYFDLTSEEGTKIFIEYWNRRICG